MKKRKIEEINQNAQENCALSSITLQIKSEPLKSTTNLSPWHNLEPLEKKQQLLKILRKNNGFVSYACKELNIARSTYYDILNSDEEFKAEVEQINEDNIDIAENSLMEQIKSQNFISTIFYLKTKGRSRGYVERENNDKQVIEVHIPQLPTQQINKPTQQINKPTQPNSFKLDSSDSEIALDI